MTMPSTALQLLRQQIEMLPSKRTVILMAVLMWMALVLFGIVLYLIAL